MRYIAPGPAPCRAMRRKPLVFGLRGARLAGIAATGWDVLIEVASSPLCDRYFPHFGPSVHEIHQPEDAFIRFSKKVEPHRVDDCTALPRIPYLNRSARGESKL